MDPADPPALRRANSDMPGPRPFSGAHNDTWRMSPATSVFPPGRTTPAQAPPQPRLTTTPLHGQSGRPTSWPNNGAGIAGKDSKAAHPPTPHRDTDPDPGGGWKPDKMPYKAAILRLHADLPKPHSSLLTQIRTGKIGLAAFLHRCRVPGFESLACPCGWQWETAKHIVLGCPPASRRSAGNYSRRSQPLTSSS